MNKQLSAAPHALDLARKVLRIEADAVSALVQRIDDSFLRALDLILSCEGRVIFCRSYPPGHTPRQTV